MIGLSVLAVATTTPSDAEAAKPKKQASAKSKKKKKKEEPKPEEAGPRRIALVVTGPKAKQFRGRIADQLEGDDIELLSEKESKGLKPDQDSEKYAAFAEKKEVTAIVLATVKKKGKNWELTVDVRNGADGESLSDVSLKGKSEKDLQKKIDADLASELADPLVQAKAPGDEQPAEPEPEPEPEPKAKKKPKAEQEPKAKPEPKPEPEPEPEPAKTAEEDAAGDEKDKGEDEPKAAATGDLPSAIELGLGLKGFRRSYDYSDDLSDLKTYSLDGAPAGFIYLRLYPAAFSSAGFVSNIGITGGYEQAFALKSKDSDGRELTTSSREYFAGLRLRIPIAAHELGIVAAYGSHSFEIDSDVTVPDVDYSFIRAVVDARFRIGKGIVGFHVGPRIILGTGELGDIFPDATTTALEAGLTGGYALSPNFDFMGGLELKRYGITLNPDPDDLPQINGAPAAAGGALDQYLGLWLGVAWHN